MTKKILLDLYCCAGGAARGYQMAGFHVVGVDIKPQPHYVGDEFFQGDALDFVRRYGKDYYAIHASPPCQGYSKANNIAKKDYPMLIGETRQLLQAAGRYYIIENVVGAPLNNPTLLCGATFGLRTYRHRLFETNFSLPFMMHMGHGLSVDKSSGVNRQREMVQVWGNAQYAGYKRRAKDAMGIDWNVTEHELAEAIPPAYTKWIGERIP